MKKIIAVVSILIMVFALSACSKKRVKISNTSLAKLEQTKVENAIKDFWNNLGNSSYTYLNTANYNTQKYNKITSYSAVGVTTPSYINYDCYKIVQDGSYYKVNVRVLYKNIVNSDIYLCLSDLDNNFPRYTLSYKNLDMPNAAKITGDIYYETWDNVNGGQYYLSSEKSLNIDQSFDVLGEKITTGLGKDDGTNGYAAIYRDDKAVWNQATGIIANMHIKKDKFFYYTPVGTDFERSYTMKIIKVNKNESEDSDEADYVYRVDMSYGLE